MKRLARGIFVGIAAASIAGGAEAKTWRTYFNPRFGVSADVPSDWKIGPEPVNGDGRAFTSPNGSAEIGVTGIFSVLPRDEEILIRTTPGAGGTITYKVVQGNVVVVSGTRGDRIFYYKSLLNCGIWNDLSIEYPARDKAEYDPLVAHVAASLKPGRGYNFVPCQ
jgi:hypothetical protein